MQLTTANCEEYLAARVAAAPVAVRELGGGVSNTVLLVEEPGRRYILKQALGRLRVQDEWLADRSRIFREARCLQDAAHFLPAGSVPRVLWVDEANFCFAMTEIGRASCRERV